MAISLKVTDKTTGEVIRFKVKDGTPKEKFPAAAKKALEIHRAKRATAMEAEPAPAATESPAPESRPSTKRTFVCSVCRDQVDMDILDPHVAEHQKKDNVGMPENPNPKSSSQRKDHRPTR